MFDTTKKSFFIIFGSIFIILFVAVGCVSSNRSMYMVDMPCLASINIIDRNGMIETINNPERLEQYTNVDFLQPQPYQKVLRIYDRDPFGNIHACITSYHPNGYPRQYLEVVNSRACGAYKEWHPNGILRIDAYVIEGTADIVDGAENSWIFDGCCQVWDENGNLEANIPYLKGLLDGVSTHYHPNGNVWKIIPYCKGKVDGINEIYCADGTLLSRCNYSNNFKSGEAFRFWSGDKTASEELFCDGFLSFGRYYNTDGECVAEVNEGFGTRAILGKDCIIELQEYQNGILEGEIKVLDKNLRVTKIYHAKEGNKHGEELYYYETLKLQSDPTPKLSINWYEGKIQGVVKTWYSNGVQESQREMSENKRNGHSLAWYRDGSLLMIEEYEQDKLTRGGYYIRGEKTPISTIDEGRGTATIYDPDGNFVRKIEYRNGKPKLEE